MKGFFIIYLSLSSQVPEYTLFRPWPLLLLLKSFVLVIFFRNLLNQVIVTSVRSE
jgi:hypothetical protein